MPSEVRHLVDRGQAYPLVRLSGVLDGATTTPVRSALLDVLAAQPEAMVVDVTGLRLAEPDAIQVLREVLDETRDWPGSHLALCGTPDVTAWRPTGWPVWPDASGAFAALGAPDSAEHRIAVDLEPVTGAARRAREVITEACGRWDRPDVAGNACIVATEMVNNVVAHVRTPMSLLLALHGETMDVAVRDFSPALPRYGGPVAPTAYGGRGLLLIGTVAEQWGHLALDGGKVVWARLGTAGRKAPTPRPGMIDPARG
ncbi:ATP-binding protein [Actinoplanes sp. CA-252034]|uniref:ATP-binding protein n=1 Tax=Actinoplanes sp. CA-252034 TaxID=3239906 RepID=UPI003D98D4B4